MTIFIFHSSISSIIEKRYFFHWVSLIFKIHSISSSTTIIMIYCHSLSRYLLRIVIIIRSLICSFILLSIEINLIFIIWKEVSITLVEVVLLIFWHWKMIHNLTTILILHNHSSTRAIIMKLLVIVRWPHSTPEMMTTLNSWLTLMF